MRGLSKRETRYAQIALKNLSTQDLLSLQQGNKVYKMNATEGGTYYIYRSSPRIRIVFKTLSAQELEIEDVISHDTLQRYFNWRGE